jgi:hypothetical protein
MDGHTHLEDNEIDLMILFYFIHIQAVQHRPPDQTRPIKIHNILLEAYSFDLNIRQTLSSNEERLLLRQLSVVVFCNTDFMPVPTFPRATPIQITRLLHQRKMGDEGRNRRLQLARNKIVKKWVGHLPETTTDKLLSELFDDLDTELATPAVKTYHNTHLRLNPKTSASLEAFSGLNGTQYVQFSRILFHFKELRILAPITEVHSLRAAKSTHAYTPMKRSVVNMTWVTKKGGSHLSRKTQVGVMTVRLFLA